MENWKLEREVTGVLRQSGLRVIRLAEGASPYSRFDLIAHPNGFQVGVDPGTYKMSPVNIVTDDPETSYKGRHGKGRLFVAGPSPDGIVKVASNGDFELKLADGTCLGRKKELTLGDLFPETEGEIGK